MSAERVNEGLVRTIRIGNRYTLHAVKPWGEWRGSRVETMCGKSGRSFDRSMILPVKNVDCGICKVSLRRRGITTAAAAS